MFTKPNFRQRLVSLLCALMATFAGGMAYAEEAPVTYTAISGTAGFQGESYENIFDGSTSSKWCATMNTTKGLEVIFQTSRPISVWGYSITTANDNAKEKGRNPKSWVLYGSNDEGSDKVWTVIDQVKDDALLQDQNFTKFDITCDVSTSYKYFKWHIAANKGANVMQVSEFTLIENTCLHEQGGVSAWTLTSTVAPSCTEAGCDVYTCSLCNGTRRQYNSEPLGHNLVLHPAVDGSETNCTHPAHGDYYECDRCGALFTDAAGTVPTTAGALFTPIDQGTVGIVTDEQGNSDYYVPFCNDWRYATTISYYTPDEVGGAAVLNSLSFYVKSRSSLAVTDMKIYLAPADAAQLSVPDPSTMTLVYEAHNTTIGAKQGWETYNFSTPYFYNGNTDLAVIVLRSSSSYESSLKYSYIATDDKSCKYRLSDSDTYCAIYDPQAEYNTRQQKPFVKFGFGGHVLHSSHTYNCMTGGIENTYNCVVCGTLKSSKTPATDDDIIDTPVEKAPIGYHVDADKDEVCDVCDNFFHDLVHHAADKAELTCAHPVHKEYWQCATCHALFLDAAATEEVSEDGVINHVTGEICYETTSTDGSRYPFYSGYNNSTVLVYYTADEVRAKGLISGLQFKVAENQQSLDDNKVWIYLATVEAGSMAKPALRDLTLVYEGENLTVGGAAGWQSWAFNRGQYLYDGTGDLLVVVCRKNSNYKGADYCAQDTGGPRVFYRGSDGSSYYGEYSPSASYNTSNYLPFAKFTVSLTQHVLEKQHNYNCLEGGYYDSYRCTVCGKLKSTADGTTDNDVIDAPVVREATGAHVDEDGDYYCEVCGHTALDADGLYDGVFPILTPDDLKAFANRVNAGETNLNARLVRDIDMTGVTDYVPAAYATSLDNLSYNVAADAVIAQPGYTGTFDGRGHVIKNLTLASDIVRDDLCSTGIFGNVSGAVKNLGIDKFNFTNTTGKDGRFGTIAGVLLPGAEVTDCFVTNSSLTDKDHILGFIAGGNYGGAITNCYVKGCSKTSHSRCGYLVGDMRNDYKENPLYGTITNCFTSASRNTSSSVQVVVGTDGTTYSVSDALFRSGEVCFLLNGEREEADRVWFQTLEGSAANAVPSFATVTTDVVRYGYTDANPCGVKVYVNAETSDTERHDLVHHEAREAQSCLAPGCVEHWEGSFCYKTFRGAEATAEVPLTDVHQYPDGSNPGVFTFESRKTSAEYNYPFSNWHHYGTTVMIYTPEEVGAHGDISAIAFRHNGSSPVKNQHLRIYMAETTGTVASDMSMLANALLVGEWDDYTLGTPANDWETFTFNKGAFHYSGTKNLAVIVTKQATTYNSNVQYLATTATTNRTCNVRDDYDATYGDWKYCFYHNMGTSKTLPIAQFTVNAYGQHGLAYVHNYDCLEGGIDNYYECQFCHILKITDTPTTDDDVLDHAPASRPAMGHTDANADHRCDECGTYLIATAADLKDFASAVNGGEYSLNAALVADVDLSDAAYTDFRIGNSSSKAYQGTFDGLYHTINYNFTATEAEAALFRYVEDATLKNLHVTGSMTSDKQFASGLVSYASGATKFYNVWSSVDMTANVDGDATYGGILARNNSAKSSTHCTVFENCLYDGNFLSGTGYANGGIVGWLHDNSKATLRNCLVVGNYAAGTENSSAVTRNVENNAVTIENCYFLNTYGRDIDNGTQTTAEALADGTILAALNGEGDTWYQVCTGDDPMAYPVPWTFGVYDTNGNGIISIADVNTYIGNLSSGTPVYDINADGDVDTSDVTKLADKVLKK